MLDSFRQVLVLALVIVATVLPLAASTDATTDGGDGLVRAKRQYYDNDYYSSYYGWQAGRVIGWILGFIVLMLIICVPCICCIGIWFAGWFGVRQAMDRRRRTPGGRTVLRAGESPPSPLGPGEQRVVYAGRAMEQVERQTGYFEGRRPRTPPNSGNSGNNSFYGREREARRV
ncbi:hypothetical protein AAVH_03798 [Aphelenchoides avenae]|nr:hypothetical protein AAVH_03798 [Aphelenchus avenae]